MTVTMENQISDEDALQIEANKLGVPMYVYRLKPSYIRFIRRIGVSIFWFGAIVLVQE